MSIILQGAPKAFRCLLLLIFEALRPQTRDIRWIPYNFDMVTLRRSLPPMNALVVFEAAARHRNLTAAGAELCIAASAVSRHVATVERETGLILFIRNGNRLELTASGQRLADAVGAGLGHGGDGPASPTQRGVHRPPHIALRHDPGQ